jgi:hypothetical protein
MGSDTKARLAAAREALAGLAEKREEENAEHELAGAELEVKCEKEIGKRGDAYELVDCGPAEGWIVVRRVEGAGVLYKRFSAAMAGGKDPTQEDLDLYVAPCIAHPEKETVRGIFERRPHLKLRCANALTTLFGAKEDATRSKH